MQKFGPIDASGNADPPLKTIFGHFGWGTEGDDGAEAQRDRGNPQH